MRYRWTEWVDCYCDRDLIFAWWRTYTMHHEYRIKVHLEGGKSERVRKALNIQSIALASHCVNHSPEWAEYTEKKDFRFLTYTSVPGLQSSAFLSATYLSDL